MKTTRRAAVLGLGALAVGGSGLLRRSVATAQAAAGANIQLGAQTNAWPIDAKDLGSLLAVLGQIKQLGYAGFETGYFNLSEQFASPEKARQQIAATGLAFFGIHIALPFAKDDPSTKLPPVSLYESVARGGVALGARHLIFSAAPAATAEELARKIEALDAAGRFSKALGLPLLYHNHWWEFESKVGESKVSEIEALYEQTDPALVSFLLDAGHAYRGGADVPAFFSRHSDRIAGLHLRDYRDGKQVPLGSGTFPLAQVAAMLKQLRWKGWALNEEEREDGIKAGLGVIDPAFKALREAFPA
jgi:sugar phosphate isomerase/epimerase